MILFFLLLFSPDFGELVEFGLYYGSEVIFVLSHSHYSNFSWEIKYD